MRKRGTNGGEDFWAESRTENRGESLFERRGARAKQKIKERAGKDGQAVETKKRETRGKTFLEKERRQ